ncbi:MAG TPA: amino acid adenylation domain-containing protein, partial [Ktedonobacteraceae bacterium]|nr:amino acid adenylation domain-containing protein [Ktedonobacteraceae bacterium]
MTAPVNPAKHLSLLKRAVQTLEHMQAKLDRYEQPATSLEVENSFARRRDIHVLDDQGMLERLSDFIAGYEYLSPLKRAMLALERMQEKLAQYEGTTYLPSHEEDITVSQTSAAKEVYESARPSPFLDTRTLQERPVLSFEQQRLLFLEKLNPEKALYNEHCALRIQGSLNLEAMEQALGTITQRHTILRTSFPMREGTAIQFVHPWRPVKIIPVDLRGIADSARMSQAITLAENDVTRPMDLDRGPLLQFKLYSLAEDDYIFVVIVHHLIADGWSMGILFRELSALYAAYCRGDGSPLRDPAFQYADYAAWQRQWLKGDVLDAKLAYWEDVLADAPQVLELPSDRSRPALQTYKGAHYHFVLSEPLLDALRALSQRVGVTLYTVLLGAFQVLLWRYTGQDDVLVGTPMINRKQAELEDLIGFFVNTIVVRADLTGNPTFLGFLEQVSRTVLDAYAQQDVPFDRLLERVASQRDLSRPALFQVVFSMHQASWAKADLAELTITPFALENGRSRVDLTLEVVEGDGQVRGLVEYNTDLFDETTIVWLLEHWFTILESVVNAPQQRLSELSLLSQAEREQLLVTWNTTASNPEVVAIHRIFERVVIDRPASVAAVFENAHITYLELHHRSTQLAAHLLQIGVGLDTPVGVCVERSLDMLIAALGVMKAGAVYVPLDPTYPYERLAFILADVAPPALLTQSYLADGLPICDAQIVCLDTDWNGAIEVTPELSSFPEVNAHNLAYIIYTSGSTGVPKGVMVEHQGLNNLVQAQIQLFDLVSSSHVLQFAAFGFDAWISEVFTTLLAGATLYLNTKEALLPGPDLLQTLQHRAITCITLPPTALAALPVCDLTYLQTIVSAGEACTAALAAVWAVGRRFLNAYGPTEATVCATAMQCHADMLSLPIGRPIENVQIYLLDASLQPAPVGVPGELYIAGIGLARGYLKRPDVTAASFIPHPFSHSEGARLYRTGDIARYKSDGTLEFLGRIDHQVKVRGFRIELGEIEAVLALHATVQDAVVIVREDIPSDKRIIAYLVAKAGIALSVSDIYAFLKERLPDYLLPAGFVQLDTLPLNPHGKVDRQSLPDPESVRAELDVEYRAPRTRIERVIAE